MTEKRIGATDSTNVRPGKGVETHAVAAPFQKGQSASNLLGALAAKPAAGAGGVVQAPALLRRGRARRADGD